MADQASRPTRGVTVGELRSALAELNWSAGLTRDQVRRKCRILPQPVYLHLPSSKRYYSVEMLLHDAAIAPSRAEGDFLGAAPDLPEDEVLDEGGPPAWGPDPLFTPGASVDGTSAEDRDPEDVGE